MQWTTGTQQPILILFEKKRCLIIILVILMDKTRRKRKAARCSQAMDIVAARSIGLKPSSMSIACENYHRGRFRRGKSL
jgi:hypothetical protein